MLFRSQGQAARIVAQRLNVPQQDIGLAPSIVKPYDIEARKEAREALQRAELAPGEEATKGFVQAAKGLTQIPNTVGLQRGLFQNELANKMASAYDKIDSGDIKSVADMVNTGLDVAVLGRYMDANEEQRKQIREQSVAAEIGRAHV